jgi:hypothetical protein
MYTITPIEQVSRNAVIDMAHAAADRGDCIQVANVFPEGGTNRALFDKHFHERDMALCEAVTS